MEKCWNHHNADNIVLNSVQAVSYLLHLPDRWFPSSHSDDALSMSDSSWLFTSLLDLCNINGTGLKLCFWQVALLLSNLDFTEHAAHNGKIRHAFWSNDVKEKRNSRWQNILKMDLAEQGVNIWFTYIWFIWFRIINQIYQSTRIHLLKVQQNCIRYVFLFVKVITGLITD